MNSEIKQYFDILSNGDFPNFILPYLGTKSLKRLSGVGMFCGMDYCNMKLYDMKYFFSRLDHSIACACMAWHLTRDKTHTILALLHDIGTPVFSHCVDYMLGDSETQESSELNIYDVVLNDKNLSLLLIKDAIEIEELNNISKYTIVENKKPKLCIDRLEGVFSSSLVWLKNTELSELKNIYKNLEIGLNNDKEQEMCFSTKKSAKKVFKKSLELGYACNSNEDIFCMKYVGDVLKYILDKGYICYEDLFTMTEKDVINIINNSNDMELKILWFTFVEMKVIGRSDSKKENMYCVSLETKKRYVDPIYKISSGYYRLTDNSRTSKKELKKYLDYSDSKYSYIYLDKNIFNVKQKNLKKDNL